MSCVFYIIKFPWTRQIAEPYWVANLLYNFGIQGNGTSF